MKKIYLLLILLSFLPSFGGAVVVAQSIDKTICTGTSFAINSTEDATGSTYQWLENGQVVSGATAAGYTIAGTKAAGVYTYIRQSKSATCVDWQSSNAYTVEVRQSATFATFNPSGTPTVNTGYCLTDDRAGAGNQTYTVRYLADGRYWMVDDMKYPTACNKTAFTGSTTVTASTMNKGRTGVLGLEDFYGDCRNNTQPGAGYLYDWAFVMQQPGAAYGGTWTGNCTANASSNALCQGICPSGWHVPTGEATTGEFTLLNAAVNGGLTNTDAGLRAGSNFNGVYSGYCNDTGSLANQGIGGDFWSSSWHGSNYAYGLNFGSNYTIFAHKNNKYYGLTLRCVRNY